ncbi:MAG: hypothetical protein H6506_00250 [Calditrichaeota bacterium]|nr:hypothetical protein [Calditrichota bacterium]MCB9391070.1 hypothetical protein [Calditrichota bacterium]
MIRLPFVGTHSAALDDKGRLSIPAEFRNALPQEEKLHVVLTIGSSDFINAFPVDYFNTFYAPGENDTADFALEESIDRDMILLSEAAVRPIDGQGRITIPQNLLKQANMAREVIFLGRQKFFTIWNAEAYQARADQLRLSKADAWQMLTNKNKKG